MQLFTLFLIILMTPVANGQPQKWKCKKYLTAVSYNVENLFDTINDPSINDNEFTPLSKKLYDGKKYQQKIDNLAKVISSINVNEFPEIIGLCEVENRGVLLDLAASSVLQESNYKVILEEGPDPRGIDCGFMYRPDVFNYISHHAVQVRFPETNRRTRDILYVKGTVNKDTLHVFVNHWSSRRGGEAESEHKRIESAKVLKHNVDSILGVVPSANIMILGDFNDEPSNSSLYNTLEAGRLNEPKLLFNLMFELYDDKKGSYYYNKEYNMIDNLIVTRNLFTKEKGLRLYENRGWIYNLDFICFTQKNGDKSPSKSYGGNTYYGGFSDHFPIYTIFYEK